MRPIIIKSGILYVLVAITSYAYAWQSVQEAEDAILQVKNDTAILNQQYAESQKKCQESFFVNNCLEAERLKYTETKRSYMLLQTSAEQFVRQEKSNERTQRVEDRLMTYQDRMQKPPAPAKKRPAASGPTPQQQQENLERYNAKQAAAAEYAREQSEKSALAEQKRQKQIEERNARRQRAEDYANNPRK